MIKTVQNAAQTDQTELLILSISKVKEEGNESQGLSVKGISDERIKPMLGIVPIETLMEVMGLSKQNEVVERNGFVIYVVLWFCQKEVVM
ncbi:unnamed protein product [Brugia timori]|uniref:Plug domain-containing protein n=1 Tax=Brugia timori TaxID=42155 RepID=A0A0R3R0U2_9BILA|nr:unnamed protein product [Brugia timori]